MATFLRSSLAVFTGLIAFAPSAEISARTVLTKHKRVFALSLFTVFVTVG
jgi:hypothetical protein